MSTECSLVVDMIYFMTSSIIFLTNSMDQSPWEANSYSASQEIPCLLWKSWTWWNHLLPSCPVSWRSVLILSYHLYLDFSIWYISFMCPHQNPHTCQCLNHLILLVLVTQIFGEEYWLCSSMVLLLCCYFPFRSKYLHQTNLCGMNSRSELWHSGLVFTIQVACSK